jgi:outer membrane receptor protein involved in Fe transport
VISAYLQGANKFGAIGVQLGLRAEYSDITTFLEQGAVENKRDYLDFFPTLHTTYHFNDYNAWQISYSRRINRPHFWSLNPFYGFSDSRNISTGNPNLEPEYTDAYESGYVYTTEASSFYAGVYYRYTSDVIERISYVDEAGITFSVPRNLAERHAYGAETNLSVDPLKWWNLSANVNVYRMQTEGVFEYNNKVTDLSADTYSWDTRINSRMRWDNGLSFQTTFFYRGKEENTQGVRKPFYMMNASLSKEVLKGNGTLTFNVRDVLDSRKFRYELNQPDLVSVNERRWSGQQFRLTFVYRLNQNGRRSANGGGEEDNGMGDGGF